MNWQLSSKIVHLNVEGIDLDLLGLHDLVDVVLVTLQLLHTLEQLIVDLLQFTWVFL